MKMTSINFLKTLNLSNANKNKYFKMYFNTYSKIGSTFNKNQLFKYYLDLIKLSKNNKTGIILYWANPRGKKIGLLFANNKNFQKQVVIPYSGGLLKNSSTKFYVEASNAYEHLLRKNKNIMPITNGPIIRKIIGNNKLVINNSGQYERHIPGVGMHKKRLYGHPDLK
jgi:hypothetical protein